MSKRAGEKKKKKKKEKIGNSRKRENRSSKIAANCCVFWSPRPFGKQQKPAGNPCRSQELKQTEDSSIKFEGGGEKSG